MLHSPLNTTEDNSYLSSDTVTLLIHVQLICLCGIPLQPVLTLLFLISASDYFFQCKQIVNIFLYFYRHVIYTSIYSFYMNLG